LERFVHWSYYLSFVLFLSFLFQNEEECEAIQQQLWVGFALIDDGIGGDWDEWYLYLIQSYFGILCLYLNSYHICIYYALFTLL